MRIIETLQRSQVWYDARKGIPTASRFDMILTAKEGKPSKSQEKLINELIAEAILPPEQGVVKYFTPEMEQGIVLEAEARCAFELQFAKAPVSEVGFILHDSGAFGCSPDGLVGDDSGLEIKCPQGPAHVGYFRAGVLPDDYKCQVHGSMIVTGRKEWEFFSYSRNLPPLRVLTKWDSFTDALERELLAFVERLNTERARFGLGRLGV